MVGRQLVVPEAPKGLPPDRRQPCGVAGGLEGLPQVVHLIVGYRARTRALSAPSKSTFSSAAAVSSNVAANSSKIGRAERSILRSGSTGNSMLITPATHPPARRGGVRARTGRRWGLPHQPP